MSELLIVAAIAVFTLAACGITVWLDRKDPRP